MPCKAAKKDPKQTKYARGIRTPRLRFLIQILPWILALFFQKLDLFIEFQRHIERYAPAVLHRIDSLKKIPS